MPASLLEMQCAILDAVAGPGADLPLAWFAMAPDRAALGISAHATTVRHARADAIGAGFPRTLALLGPAFPGHAEAYLEAMGPTRLLPQELGHGFAAYLFEAGEERAAELAAIEWAMLQAYHAPDRANLGWPRIAVAGDPRALHVGLHPAVAMLPACDAVLKDLGLIGDGDGFILVARPETQVRLHAAGGLAAALAGEIGGGNVLGAAVEQAIRLMGATESEAFAAFSVLVAAGALVETGEQTQ